VSTEITAGADASARVGNAAALVGEAGTAVGETGVLVAGIGFWVAAGPHAPATMINTIKVMV
jgi:hypothetical protein